MSKIILEIEKLEKTIQQFFTDHFGGAAHSIVIEKQKALHETIVNSAIPLAEEEKVPEQTANESTDAGSVA